MKIVAFQSQKEQNEKCKIESLQVQTGAVVCDKNWF